MEEMVPELLVPWVLWGLSELSELSLVLQVQQEVPWGLLVLLEVLLGQAEEIHQTLIRRRLRQRDGPCPW